jgi:mRNA interferase YafQ
VTLEIYQTTQFRRDLRKLKRQGKDLAQLLTVIELLAEEQELPANFRDHTLTGNWSGYSECHIRPDWLLIYQIDGDSLTLERSGSHSDLFK